MVLESGGFQWLWITYYLGHALPEVSGGPHAPAWRTRKMHARCLSRKIPRIIAYKLKSDNSMSLNNACQGGQLIYHKNSGVRRQCTVPFPSRSAANIFTLRLISVWFLVSQIPQSWHPRQGATGSGELRRTDAQTRQFPPRS